MHKIVKLDDAIKMIEILNFDKKSTIDLTLLIEDFIKKTEIYTIDKKIYNNGNLLVNKNISNYVVNLKQYSELDNDIKNYLKNFSLEEFVLRKINYYGVFPYNKLKKLFCEVQQVELDRLKDKGYLISEYTDDIPDDYQVVRLSKKGLVKLFKINNAKEIEHFVRELQSLKYDTRLLDDFLKICDLDNPVWSVLNKENIDRYCDDFDICKFIIEVECTDEKSMIDSKSKAYYKN